MKHGLAPVGFDGTSVNIHHLIQIDGAAVAEVGGRFHKQYHKILHINPSSTPSGINRPTFDIWRQNYWKERANDF